MEEIYFNAPHLLLDGVCPAGIQYPIMLPKKLLFAWLLAAALPAQAAMGVRVALGLTDQNPTKWDGSAVAHGARIASIEGWRFDGDDALAAGDSWKISTRRIRLFGANAVGAPSVANGVVVWLEGERDNADIAIKTAQGEFTVRLADIPYGTMKHYLDGRATADRLPPVTRITNSPDEDDYPAAAADRNGNVWMAYMSFQHHPRHDELRTALKEAVKDFSPYKEPPGGDQVLLRKCTGGVWGEAIEVTRPGGDLYRPAVAIDGSGRAWVFWPGNEKGIYEMWAAVVENGKAGAPMKLPGGDGSNIDPVATTDSTGRVWVAWQGWRKGHASIFAATQQGSGMSKPAVVAASIANEWNPAIAANSSGGVTVAWDSYRNGNYDVYMKTARGPGAWGKEMVVAASAKYEAYPSLAYDPSGRLWVAYEEGGERWGKDFGAYETTGLALYQGRAIRVAVFDKNGQMSVPAADVSAVLPGAISPKVDATARQGDSWTWEKPDPANARNRDANRPETNVAAPRNTLPRIQVDASGRVWLACRSNTPSRWNPLGTVYTEYLASYDGSRWTGPMLLAHSDNILDNRPALVSVRAGELMVINSSDGRFEFPVESRHAAAAAIANFGKDPFNNDLYSDLIALAPASGPAAVTAAAQPAVASPDPLDKAEQSAIAAMRNLRVKGLKMVRGEFHRHSEISMDGGGDGTILDQWRYSLDAGALDWVGCCDHDNGGGREYSWWITQKETQFFYSPGKFVPMFNYERSVAYPEGHRNVIFAQRGIRTLPRLPKTGEETAGPAPDTQMLYAYLKAFDGIVASHTSGTSMGTDWRDNDPLREPIVEIYQGERQNYEMPDAPRTNKADDSIGGWKPKGFVNLALEKGYKMSFQASSDHISTHMSYCNIFVTDYTREAVLDGFKKRHVYGSTDNILADFRAGDHMLGDAFSASTAPEMKVKLAGTGPFSKIQVIKDNAYVYSASPNKQVVEFTWKDNSPQMGKTSYYYVRGEQSDGNIVWVSPIWVTYK
jgi:hypothetical protein